MADPFANLFSSFKNENGSAPGVSSQNASLNDLLSSRGSTPQAGAAVSNSGSKDNSQDLLGDLESSLRSTVEGNINGTSTNGHKDDFDLAFESFNAPPPQPAEKPPQESETEQPVVDEVKDMEIARLMSLDISFDQAVQYYDKGVLYDQLIDKQRDRNTLGQRAAAVAPRPEKWKGNQKNDFTSLFQVESFAESPPALMSMASNLLNMGKDFIEDKLKPTFQDQHFNSDSDRLSAETSRRYQHRPNAEAETQTSFSRLTMHDDALPIHQPSQLNKEMKHRPVTTASPQREDTPQQEEALLDFDNVPLQSSSPQYSISSFELTSYNEFKSNGAKLFASGDYSSSLREFEKSFNTLPSEHPLCIISLSNIISCQMKLGENANALKSINDALQLLEKAPDTSCIIEHSSPQRTYKQISNKVQIKHAELQEHMENYEKALSLYVDLIANNVTDFKVMEGKRRCEKIVYPEKFKPVKQVTRQTTSTEKKSSANQADSATVTRIKQEAEKQRQEEEERVQLYDRVQEKIHKWCGKNKDDLRYLLANLEPLLKWTTWKEIHPQDLVMTKKVKIYYLKAIAKTHPDKIPPGTSTEDVMIAENVFMILTKAWEHFKSENNL